jgi:hypothetical protein
MSLSNLLNIPKNENEWDVFAFNNREQNTIIRQAILAQKNINLTEYQLYPIDFTHFDYWLEQNQQAHSDFNSALGLQSSDIEELDPKNDQQLQAWVYLQYQELFSASQALKI